MGRTQRQRRRKSNLISTKASYLDHDEKIIKLRKFMIQNGFEKEYNISLRDFPATGRGVYTRQLLPENEILIQVPYDLMITITTLQSMNFARLFPPNTKLRLQDLLTLFLILERHKKHSFWEYYINSLPDKPPWLPLLLSLDQMELLPADLRLVAKKSRRLLEESFARLTKSIRHEWTCDCCHKNIDRILDFNIFTWAYIIVNSRAVYVNPEIVQENNKLSRDNTSDLLLDEPNMALCPLLDMFNHNDKCRTEAELIYVQDKSKLMFQMKTLTKYEKFEQIFISYGAHDNLKLFNEYGFFIQDNCYNFIQFDSKDIFKLVRSGVNEYHYKFIRSHNLDNDLYISHLGLSFNLKAILFIMLYGDQTSDLSAVIYSDLYPDHFFIEIKSICTKLLSSKLNIIVKYINKLDSDCFKLVKEYLTCQKAFIQKIYFQYTK